MNLNEKQTERVIDALEKIATCLSICATFMPGALIAIMFTLGMICTRIAELRHP